MQQVSRGAVGTPQALQRVPVALARYSWATAKPATVSVAIRHSHPRSRRRIRSHRKPLALSGLDGCKRFRIKEVFCVDDVVVGLDIQEQKRKKRPPRFISSRAPKKAWMHAMIGGGGGGSCQKIIIVFPMATPRTSVGVPEAGPMYQASLRETFDHTRTTSPSQKSQLPIQPLNLTAS